MIKTHVLLCDITVDDHDMGLSMNRNADGLTEEQVGHVKGAEYRLRQTGSTNMADKLATVFPATFSGPEPIMRYKRTDEWAVPEKGQWFESFNGEPKLCKIDDMGQLRWILCRNTNGE